MLKLYGYFRSSAAFRVRVALNLKGLAYEQVFVHLRRNDQRSPAYLAKNPQGLVPLLESDGASLVQSLAIIEYLDETHPAPKLLPEGSEDRARVRALAQIIAADIHPLDNLRVLRFLANPLGHDDKTIEQWFNHWIRLGFEALEPMLQDPRTSDFCHGNAPGLADICLVPQVFNAKRYPSFDMAPFPTIARVFGNCMKLDAFSRAAPDQQPDFEK
jgi:maleylacetoacetate isomerase